MTLVGVDLGSSLLAGGADLATWVSLSASVSSSLERGRVIPLSSEPTTGHWGSAMGESPGLPLRSAVPARGQLGKEINYNTSGQVT